YQVRLEVAIEVKGDVGDTVRFDQPARIGAVGLQHRGLRGHVDRFGNRADFEGHVHADGRVYVHLDVQASHLLEPLQLRGHGVLAVPQTREAVVARLVADRRATD